MIPDTRLETFLQQMRSPAKRKIFFALLFLFILFLSWLMVIGGLFK